MTERKDNLCEPFGQSNLERVNNALIVTKEKKRPSKYIIDNINRLSFSKYLVDGGLITESSKRCDYLILKCNNELPPDAYFIELKGADYREAINQINISIDKLYSSIANSTVNARIVVTTIQKPRLYEQIEFKLKERLRKLNRGDLRTASGVLTERILA
jgi:hypothetical protein